MLLATQNFVPTQQKLHVMIAGISGIITYLLIEGFTHYLEKHEEMRLAKCAAQSAGCTGLVSFLYLELIDASFSLDGVLGAFALSKDIIIISIGLAIGAMFVRSLTILLVEKKTLGTRCALGYWGISLSNACFYSKRSSGSCYRRHRAWIYHCCSNFLNLTQQKNEQPLSN